MNYFDICKRAARQGDLVQLQQLADKVDQIYFVYAIQEATRVGQLQCLAFLIKLSLRHGNRLRALKSIAIKNGQLDALKMLDERIPSKHYTISELNKVGRFGSIDMIEWVLKSPLSQRAYTNPKALIRGLAAKHGRLDICRWLDDRKV